MSMFNIIAGWGRAFAHLPRWEKFLFGFWLSGPFLMLIERTPADVWCSLLVLFFLARSFLMKDFGWIKLSFVRLGALFVLFASISALLSSNPIFSVSELLIWTRFPLLAVATVWWFGVDRRMLYLMAASITLAVIIMCGIMLAEMALSPTYTNRLFWPYGDPVSGNYLVKVGLPSSAIMLAYAVSRRGGMSALAGFFAVLTIAFSVFAGERVNSLIRICAGFLAVIAWKPIWSRVLLLIGLEVLVVVLIFADSESIQNRYTQNFVKELPFHSTSGYFKAMLPAFWIFDQHPIFGIGPANFELLCGDFNVSPTTVHCHPHPHNYYAQLLAETGIVGLLIGGVWMSSIVWSCYKSSRKSGVDVLCAVSFIAPLAFFWPIATTADFYGQWNNSFMWSSIAFSLACALNYRDSVSST